ncbi:hypothetical protein SNEBB_006622, partial [Seison nebaliae]
LSRRKGRVPNEENVTSFKEAVRSFKKAVRTAKRESWKSFCSTTTSLPAAARLANILKKEQRSPPVTMKKPDGNFTVTAEETIELLLDTHFPDLDEQEEAIAHGPLPCFAETHASIVTEDKVEESFNSFAPYKAGGPQGITPAMVQKGINALKEPLTRVFRACLNQGCVPKSWTKSRVVFIPKPGKEDYSDPKSFRPISLSSVLLKGLERLIYWYLVENPLKDRVFHKNQYAYRAGTSTEEALHTLVTKAEKAVFGGQVAIAVFLDIEGAFNNARVKSMVQAILGREVPDSITSWVGTLLSSREVESTLLTKSKSKSVMKGCPQGGVLSPLLWNLVMDSLLAINEEQRGVHAQAYADDVTILQSGPIVGTVANLVQQNLRWLENWSETHHLRFSPHKTEVIMFTRKRVGKPDLFLYGEKLAYSKTTKYLGATLDRGLSWTPHVEAVTKKATIALARCRRAIGTTWGMSSKSMEWIYTSVIRPIVEYGCLIWSPSLTLKTVQKKLNMLQRSALVSITAAYPSTPTSALEALLNIPPLPTYLTGVAIKAAHRMKLNGQWKGTDIHIGNRKSHVDVLNRWLQESKALQMPVDKLKLPERPHERNFIARIPTREDYHTTGPSLKVKEESEVICFTDGSKTEIGTGVGSVIRTSNIQEDISLTFCSNASVYQMEITAVSVTAETLLQMGTEDKNVTIYSDSQATVKALMSNPVLSKSTLECIRKLNELAETNRVSINWIPAHQGYEGNELADSLAKAGANDHFIGPTPSIPIPLSQVRRIVKENMHNVHKQEWLSKDECRQTKMFCLEPSSRRKVELLKLKRQELRDAIQVLTGHANLARHKHLCKKSTSPICASCKTEEETASHFLARCPRYDPARLQVFGHIKLRESDFRTLPTRDIAAFNKATNRLANHADP